MRMITDPDATSSWNSSPDYLRELISRIGVSQREAARRLGVNEATMRRWLTYPDRSSYSEPPYTAVFALEVWAELTENR